MTKRQTILFLLGLLTCSLTIYAADASGKWTTTISTQIGELAYAYDFKVEGDKLTGKAKSQFGDVEITEGKVKGDEITFVENVSFEGNAIRIEYKGQVSAEEIKFTRKVGEFATEEFVAKRAK
jgi:cytoskeletal protein CcmA (bactofilin family)